MNPENATDPAEIEENAGDAPPQNSDATPVSASKFVQEDKDRPVADNNLPPPERPDDPTDTPNTPAPEGTKKRGRKPLDEAEKKRRALLRNQAKLEGKPPPTFDDLKTPDGRPLPPSSGQAMSGLPVGKPARDYVGEALSLYVPTSILLGKKFGEHWSVKFDPEKGKLELTPDQSSYVNDFAKWLEYEQFPELNPRYKFIFSSIMYAAPRIKTDPTPEKIRDMWQWVKRLFGFGKKKQKKVKEEKDDDEKTDGPHSPE